MTRPGTPLLVRLYAAAARLLLPRDLYRRYGAEIGATFALRYREAAATAVGPGVPRLLAREIRSLLSTAWRERFAGSRPTSVPIARTAAPNPRPRKTPSPPRQRGQMFDDLRNDVRFAFRSLLKTPTFTVVAVLTLAFAVGVTTAVFSVVNGVLLRPLPYEDADRLVVVWTSFGPDLPQNWISGPEFLEMQQLSTTLDGVAIVTPSTIALTGRGEPEQVTGALASGGIFDVLRVEALRGRLFGPEDDIADGERIAVISHGFWQRRFGGDPAIVGQDLSLNGNPVTVVGILPEDFVVTHPDLAAPESIEIWAPYAATTGTPYGELGRGAHFLASIGRLRDGVSLEQARADMDAVARGMLELTPDYYDFEGWGLTVYSLHGDLVESVRPALLVLMGAVGFVLLIACVNVANLQIIRAAARERELAVRAALGAGRGRLVKQLLTESVMLATAGGALGLALTVWLVRGLAAAAPPSLPRIETIGVDGTVLLFTCAVTLLTALAFGVAPGLLTVRASLVDSLREGGRGSTEGRGAGRLRTALVVAEVALALVLLVGAGLMLRSLDNLLTLDPGYDTEGLVTLRVSLPNARYEIDEALRFHEELVRRTRSLPGVEAAGATSILPLSGLGASGTTAVKESSAVEPERDFPYPFIEADRRFVTPGYFEAMGMQLLAGRALLPSDNADGQAVAVVDDSLARRFWPGEKAVGREIAVSFSRNEETDQVEPAWRTVVGVVRHARHADLGADGREQVYVPVAQSPVRNMHLAVRTSRDPAALVGAIRAQVAELDPLQPVADVRTMEERVGRSVSQPRFNAVLLASFAGVALLLAVVGIYGVISYSVSQRSGEIGVRMALGADLGSVRTLVLRQGMLLVAVGLGIGLVAALGLSRLVASLLVAVSPVDPVTYASVAALLAAVAAAACLVPARRAARVDPISALRED